MTTDTAYVLVGECWRDDLEAGVCGRIRGFIGELLDEELTPGARACAMAGESERLPLAAARQSCASASWALTKGDECAEAVLIVAGIFDAIVEEMHQS